uniref:ATP-binding cassette, sub-family H, member 1 n=1 Tax=Oncorhynchus kisutch TaxID=8019 RepID=A0A8C7K289_ONCKI
MKADQEAPPPSPGLEDLAIRCREVCRSYGKLKVLSNLNLTVPQGHIYGLLGPSGCGKTTLLKCILGTLKISRGHISVCGEAARISWSPGPWEDGGVHATGKLLPYRYTTCHSAVQNPRRAETEGVSRSSLLQNPQLLILDEPTVGVDPVLRAKIWQHLVEIVKTGKVSVVITTHYIEEARQANVVGLMRNGRMLAEGEPETLMKQNSAATLEKAFLQLCETSDQVGSKHSTYPQGGVLESGQSLESGRDESLPILGAGSGPVEELPKYSADWKVRVRHVMPKWRNIAALIIKTTVRMKRMPGSLFFQFLLPVMQISLMCLCIGGDPKGIQVAVVNNETSSSSFSQSLLSFLDNSSVQQVNLSHAEAFAGAYNGEYWAVIGFGNNFTSYLTKRMIQRQVSKEVVDGGSVHVWLDLTNRQIALMLQKKIKDAFEVHQSSLFFFEEPIYGSMNSDFTTFVTPGAVLSITFYLAVGLTALSFVIERKEGLMERCWVSGVSSMETVLAYLISQLIIISVQIILLLILMLLVFKIPNEGNLMLVIALIVLQGITGTSFGLVISSAIDDEQNATQAALGIFYPNLIVSGIIWPVECIPYPLRYISLALPQTYASEALRCIMYRGWGLSRMIVWRGFVVTLGWNTFFVILAIVILKLRM